MAPNKTLIFKKVPTGFPVEGEHLTIEDRPLDTSDVPSGGFTAKVYYVSFDPYQRGRMRDPSIKSYAPPFDLNGPVKNRAIIKIIKSDNPDFAPDDIVYLDGTPTAQYVAVSQEHANQARKINNPYGLDLKYFIGPLGMPGLTAYSSFYDIGQPKKGETILVTAASGAVGQLVGQLAKHEGLKVIGSVGDDAKLEYITKELGFDSGFNYKKENVKDALKRLAPDGIDIYYENVGGEHLEAALDALNNFGRIVACGMISQYNLPPEKQYGVHNLFLVVGKRLTIRGFIVGDPNMGPKYAKEHQENVQKWIHDGSFKARLSETVGIDNAAKGLLGMLEGKNFGKAILVVDELEVDVVLPFASGQSVGQ